MADKGASTGKIALLCRAQPNGNRSINQGFWGELPPTSKGRFPDAGNLPVRQVCINAGIACQVCCRAVTAAATLHFFQRSCVHHATTTSYTDNITLHGSVWHKNIFICICQLAYSSAQPRFHRNSACFDRKAYGKRLDNDITILSQLVRTRLILDRVNNRITQEVV